LSFFFGPLAGGWVYQHLGKNALWFGCLLLGIVIALGFLLLSRKAKRYELIAQNQ
jgi:MFS family permease